MARPPHSSPNHCGSRSDRGRISHMGRGPPPPGRHGYNVPEPFVIQVNHRGHYTHNDRHLLHHLGEGLPTIPEEHEWHWIRLLFDGEEEETLVGLQNGYKAACLCGTRWLENGVLEEFLWIAHKNIYARYIFNDYPTKKLDGGPDRSKPKYFIGPGIDFTLAAFLVLWLLWKEVRKMEEVEVEPNTDVEARVVGALWALSGDIPAFDDLTSMRIAELKSWSEQLATFRAFVCSEPERTEFPVPIYKDQFGHKLSIAREIYCSVVPLAPFPATILLGRLILISKEGNCVAVKLWGVIESRIDEEKEQRAQGKEGDDCMNKLCFVAAAKQGQHLSNEALHIIKEWSDLRILSKVLFDHQRTCKRIAAGTRDFPPLDELEVLYADDIP
ncbi:hypothetical protein Acr_07g0004150 [Actinidia rufa]|uniref:Uncharacterized protein n=1 Tax=Actinidia rufa TaxID=165716 RepID=A0A7J0EV03_9ERIC|nr:hypothetical protein Acr_07g0004150 [Actinidia rufa]